MNRCRVCLFTGDQAILTRFSLVVAIEKPRHTSRGAGAVTLCERCWRKLTAGSRRRRQPKAVAA